jgi:hypothetical protein
MDRTAKGVLALVVAVGALVGVVLAGRPELESREAPLPAAIVRVEVETTERVTSLKLARTRPVAGSVRHRGSAETLTATFSILIALKLRTHRAECVTEHHQNLLLRKAGCDQRLEEFPH